MHTFPFPLDKISWLLCIIAGAEALTFGFALGTGSIWLDGVRCTGNESRLADCLVNPIGVHDCQHWQDAGVRCLDSGAGGMTV